MVLDGNRPFDVIRTKDRETMGDMMVIPLWWRHKFADIGAAKNMAGAPSREWETGMP